MRLVSNTPTVDHEIRRQLGEVSVVVSGGGSKVLPDLPLDSTLLLLRAHRAMKHLWAMTGTARVASKADPTKLVIEAPYEAMLRYHSFFETKVQEHPSHRRGQIAEVLRWAVDRDRRTRTGAKELYHDDGFSWGEAMERAQQELSVLWTVTEDAKAVLPEEVIDQPPGPP